MIGVLLGSMVDTRKLSPFGNKTFDVCGTNIAGAGGVCANVCCVGGVRDGVFVGETKPCLGLGIDDAPGLRLDSGVWDIRLLFRFDPGGKWLCVAILRGKVRSTAPELPISLAELAPDISLIFQPF
jgi:hypothetical protein